MQPVFHSLEDAIERSSALIGSPQQIIEKVLRYHEQMGHEVLHVHADGDGLTRRSTAPRSSCSRAISPRCCAGRFRAGRFHRHRRA